jgi:tetratricopeptide (TPR) repeat protein
MAEQSSLIKRRYVRVMPANTVAEGLSLAGACVQSGDLARADQLCRRILELDPSSAQAWFILGVVCQLSGKAGESVECYRSSLGLMPSNAETWNNLGVSLQSLRRPEEAAPCFQEALRLEPGYAQAHNNLGNALQAQGMLEEAVACYRHALHHKPDYAGAYDHLGLVLQALGRLEEAVNCHDQAIRLAPGFAEPHLHRAMAWMQMGDFTRGWNEYEWRSRCRASGIRSFNQPVWSGDSLEGRTILLHTEQGLGDAIQFIRYARLVKLRGGRVIVACQQPLVRLIVSCSGVDGVVEDGAPLPEFDCHAPLLSLPRIFETTLETVPAEIPYLAADRVSVNQWSIELKPVNGFKIGVAWQGSREHKKDRQRSFRLAELEPLARVPDVRLFSLQKGFGAEQLRDGSCGFPIVDLGSGLGDLRDTAAAITALDLVITTDTSLAHLAGALGATVWVALPVAADWRWLIGRDDSPWYSTMRLFRQARWGDWTELFKRMAGQLDTVLHGHQCLRTNPLGPRT